MKKVIAILMLCLGVQLLLSTTIINIRAQDYNGVACRFVLDLDRDSEFSLVQKRNGFQIDISGFDGKDATRKINSQFITELKILNTGLWLGTIGGLKYEVMRFDDTKQIVLDMYKPVSSREDRIFLARFYSDRGKYTKADELFAELNKDYPQDEEILDYWGTLLKRMGSKRKLQTAQPLKPKETSTGTASSPAPKESSQKPVELSTEPAGKPQLPPQPAEGSRFAEQYIDEELDGEYQNDSLVTLERRPVQSKEKGVSSQLFTNIANRYFMLILLAFVSLLVLLYILLFGFKKKKHTPKESAFEIRALHRMVGRLLADGWSHKEIAQELKISLAQVAHIANLPQNADLESLDEEAASSSSGIATDTVAEEIDIIEKTSEEADYLLSRLFPAAEAKAEEAVPEKPISQLWTEFSAEAPQAKEEADLSPNEEPIELAPVAEISEELPAEPEAIIAPAAPVAEPEEQKPEAAPEPVPEPIEAIEPEAATEDEIIMVKCTDEEVARGECDENRYRIYIKEADVPAKQKLTNVPRP